MRKTRSTYTNIMYSSFKKRVHNIIFKLDGKKFLCTFFWRYERKMADIRNETI